MTSCMDETIMRHSHTGLVEPQGSFPILYPSRDIQCISVPRGRYGPLLRPVRITDTCTAVFSGLATHDFWSLVYLGLLYCFDVPSLYLLCNHMERVFPSCRYNVPRVFLNPTCVATIFVAYPTGKLSSSFSLLFFCLYKWRWCRKGQAS